MKKPYTQRHSTLPPFLHLEIISHIKKIIFTLDAKFLNDTYTILKSIIFPFQQAITQPETPSGLKVIDFTS